MITDIIGMMNGNDFQKWIADKYQKRGWSMRELGRRAGISQSAISFVLSGQREPTFDFCAAIARALDIPATEAFRKAGLLPPQTQLVEDIAEVASNLSEYDQYALLRHAKGLSQIAEEEQRPQPPINFRKRPRRIAEVMEQYEQMGEEERKEFHRMIEEGRTSDDGPSKVSYSA